jgi:hypothetical protein
MISDVPLLQCMHCLPAQHDQVKHTRATGDPAMQRTRTQSNTFELAAFLHINDPLCLRLDELTHSHMPAVNALSLSKQAV